MYMHIGERRIRVHTMVLPVTQSLPEMLDTVDIDCTVNILAKQVRTYVLIRTFNSYSRLLKPVIKLLTYIYVSRYDFLD
jgi:hypothetical protein